MCNVPWLFSFQKRKKQERKWQNSIMEQIPSLSLSFGKVYVLVVDNMWYQKWTNYFFKILSFLFTFLRVYPSLHPSVHSFLYLSPKSVTFFLHLFQQHNAQRWLLDCIVVQDLLKEETWIQLCIYCELGLTLITVSVEHGSDQYNTLSMSLRPCKDVITPVTGQTHEL